MAKKRKVSLGRICHVCWGFAPNHFHYGGNFKKKDKCEGCHVDGKKKLPGFHKDAKKIVIIIWGTLQPSLWSLANIKCVATDITRGVTDILLHGAAIILCGMASIFKKAK